MYRVLIVEGSDLQELWRKPSETTWEAIYREAKLWCRKDVSFAPNMEETPPATIAADVVNLLP